MECSRALTEYFGQRGQRVFVYVDMFVEHEREARHAVDAHATRQARLMAGVHLTRETCSFATKES